jgi:hypothetical protein
MKDRTFYSLSKQDRLLALFGVPINYLKKPVELEQFNFAPTSIAYSVSNVVVIQSEYQKNFLNDLINNISFFGESSTFSIGSFPTDQAAYQLATILTKAHYEFLCTNKIYPRIKWIDLGSPDWEYLKSEESCSLVVIHGLSESSDNRKLEIAKDFYRRSLQATKLILAVTPNILTYTINKLETNPDGVLQLTKTTNRVVT